MLMPRNKGFPSPEILEARLRSLPELARKGLEKAQPKTWTSKSLRDERSYLLREVVFCSATRAWPNASQHKLGLDALRFAVMQACGMEADAEGHGRRLRAVPLSEDEDGYTKRTRPTEDEVVPWEKILG